MVFRYLPAKSLFSFLACFLLVAEAEAGGDPVRGRALLNERGCAGCHSYDGSARQGPTYAGLSGKTRRVVTQEKLREVVADEAYLKRSIVEPNADILEGYVPGAMPGLPIKQGEVDDLAAAIMEIGAPPKPVRAGSLFALGAATFLFIFGHLGLSSVPISRRLTGVLGQKGFQGVYSLFALGAFIWMISAWKTAPYVEVWAGPPGLRYVPLVMMPIVVFLMICGFSTKNPTSAGQEGAVKVEPVGIVRITRHPVLWSFALWGLAHLPPNGEVRALFLFGGITFLAFAGMFHIDSRRKVTLGEAWGEFAAKTSILPFARGGAWQALKEIGWVRPVLAAIVYMAILHSHKLVIGVSAMP